MLLHGAGSLFSAWGFPSIQRTLEPVLPPVHQAVVETFYFINPLLTLALASCRLMAHAGGRGPACGCVAYVGWAETQASKSGGKGMKMLLWSVHTCLAIGAALGVISGLFAFRLKAVFLGIFEGKCLIGLRG